MGNGGVMDGCAWACVQGWAQWRAGSGGGGHMHALRTVASGTGVGGMRMRAHAAGRRGPEVEGRGESEPVAMAGRGVQ